MKKYILLLTLLNSSCFALNMGDIIKWNLVRKTDTNVFLTTSYAGSVESLTGDITNSYVLVNGVVFNYYPDTTTSYSDGSEFIYKMAEGTWEYLDVSSLRKAWNPSTSYIPPTTGWLNSTGGVANITVEFVPGWVQQIEFQMVTNPVVQTVAEGFTNNVISGAAVKDAFDGLEADTGWALRTKAGTNGWIYHATVDSWWASLGSDTVAEIRDGTYTFSDGSNVVKKALTNLTIRGYGRPKLVAPVMTGANQATFYLGSAVNPDISGIDFISLCYTNTYGSEHAYNVVLNAIGGRIEDCKFIALVNLTSNNMAYPTYHYCNVVQLTNTNMPVFRNNDVITFNLADEKNIALQHLACHAGVSGVYANFDGCNFIGNINDFHIEDDLIGGFHSFVGSRSTFHMPYQDVGLMTYGQAVSRIPAGYKGYLRQINCNTFARSMDDGGYNFWCKSANTNADAWVTVIKSFNTPLRTSTPQFRMKLFAQYAGKDAYSPKPLAADFIIDGATTYTNSYYNSYSRARILNDGTNLSVQVRNEPDGDYSYMYGSIKIEACTRYENYNVVNGPNDIPVYIKFYENATE